MPQFVAESTIVVSVFSCEFVTSSLTLKAGHNFRMFEVRVPKEIFKTERDEVAGG